MFGVAFSANTQSLCSWSVRSQGVSCPLGRLCEGTRLQKVSEAFRKEAGYLGVTSPVGWDLVGQIERDKTFWESRMALSRSSSSAGVQVTAIWVPSEKLPLPCFDANQQTFLIRCVTDPSLGNGPLGLILWLCPCVSSQSRVPGGT